jgi:hypothetical protein
VACLTSHSLDAGPEWSNAPTASSARTEKPQFNVTLPRDFDDPAGSIEVFPRPGFTTKPAGEGTGPGLSMSHDIIVKQHGGTIDVETERGQFTEFGVILPRSSNFSNSNKDRGQP